MLFKQASYLRENCTKVYMAPNGTHVPIYMAIKRIQLRHANEWRFTFSELKP